MVRSILLTIYFFINDAIENGPWTLIGSDTFNKNGGIVFDRDIYYNYILFKLTCQCINVTQSAAGTFPITTTFGWTNSSSITSAFSSSADTFIIYYPGNSSDCSITSKFFYTQGLSNLNGNTATMCYPNSSGSIVRASSSTYKYFGFYFSYTTSLQFSINIYAL